LQTKNPRQMAQYRKILVVPDNNLWNSLEQRAQIFQNNRALFEVFWHNNSSRVCIKKGNEYFFIIHNMINNLTVRNVLEALGYANYRYEVYWADNNIFNNILESYVDTVQVHQAALINAN
jgi:hypothetical protein